MTDQPSRSEIAAAFERLQRATAVRDWDAWTDTFTEDCVWFRADEGMFDTAIRSEGEPSG